MIERAARTVALALGAASLAIGIAALVWPEALARQLGSAEFFGHPADTRYYRLLGLRDLVIGAGIVVRLNGGGQGSWLIARAASDALDAATIGGPALRSGRPARMLTGIGLPLSSVAGALLARWVLEAKAGSR